MQIDKQKKECLTESDKKIKIRRKKDIYRQIDRWKGREEE